MAADDADFATFVRASERSLLRLAWRLNYVQTSCSQWSRARTASSERASAVSVVTLVTATGIGVHSWRDAAVHPPVPGGTLNNHPRARPTTRRSTSRFHRRVVLGQQIRVTVTVLNAGQVYDPPAEVALGSIIPSDTFDKFQPGCTSIAGGVSCPSVGLQPG